jgi:Protein of unknown function (DUF3638)
VTHGTQTSLSGTRSSPGEAISYYRKVLVASIQNIKLFTLPFNRDVKLDMNTASILSDEFDRCKLLKGSLMVTPQQRLSLLLKQQEQNTAVDGLRDHDFLDILDESDALLCHDFQLVYALGNQEDLPNGPSRWKVLQALLLLLSRVVVSRVINDKKMVYMEKSRCGSFSNLRLLLPFRGQEVRLGRALCEHLLLDPPYNLRWMKNVFPYDRMELIKIMSDPSYKRVKMSIKLNPLFEENQKDILVARGLIAYGTLFHCLESRYRVDFGLLTESAVRLAVSFTSPVSSLLTSSFDRSHILHAIPRSQEPSTHIQTSA